MIKDNSYIVIPGWVINKYQLKGNALMIYSIIYGFCQDRTSCFCGSLQYLQEWTCSTRQGVIKVLKELVEKGLIRKEENFPTNKYYIIFEDELDNSEQNSLDSKQSLPECKQSLHSSKQSLHNNINNNIVNNIDINISSDEDINTDNININNDHINTNNNFNKKENNIYKEKKSNSYGQNCELETSVSEIISYFNKVCHTNFKSTTAATKKYIKARLKEGFSIDDFKIVIDYMYSIWGIKPIKFSNGQTSDNYLRPSTLFGPKMEEYLQSAIKSCQSSKYEVKSEKVDRSKLSDLVF